MYNLSTAGATTTVTDDQRYHLPDGVSVYPSVSCKLDFETSLVTSMSSYVESIQASASVSVQTGGFLFSGSFSTSTDYSRVKSGLSSGSSAYTQSAAQCAVYTVDFQQNTAHALNPTSRER